MISLRSQLLIGLMLPAGIAFAQQAPPPQSAAQPTRVATANNTQTSIEANLGVFVFPTKNQSTDQRRMDESHCYDWAKGQTQFDPINSPKQVQAAQAAPPPQEGGHAVRGAAGGAAIGAIAGNAGAGAAAGALAGVFRRNNQARQAAAQTDQQNAQAQAQADQANQQLAQQHAAFRKAFGVCMEGSGYNVK